MATDYLFCKINNPNEKKPLISRKGALKVLAPQIGRNPNVVCESRTIFRVDVAETLEFRNELEHKSLNSGIVQKLTN